ncbi:MAG: tRNA epoxyqueuosine(34) reductase QueG [Gammaproteobacteria bacterium]|jgi:epoxyqueuosine reductase|nr:tRNA epoxyqueuosine(34) reductase QueG [Gammaproteobacteria bacterium]
MTTLDPGTLRNLRTQLDALATELGFASLGVAAPKLEADERHLLAWLEAGWHGDMHYMARHGARRARPAELKPGTVRVISVRMNYWPTAAADPWRTLADPERAYVSRYALARDYHKIMRNALQTLADRIESRIGRFGYRVFVDSGPVLEKALARDAGLGWLGKHTNLIARDAGSWFFLGELYTDLPLPEDETSGSHCGTCEACIPACPTGAIVAPWKLDARRCISYLTIEHAGSIPEEFRPLLGNRIYGCDDCQLVCPWNKFAQAAAHPDLARVRNDLDTATLVELFAWSAEDFELRMRGSAIRRIGYERWLRNIAVALGNGPATPTAIDALRARRGDVSPVVREHVEWALLRLEALATHSAA